MDQRGAAWAQPNHSSDYINREVRFLPGISRYLNNVRNSRQRNSGRDSAGSFWSDAAFVRGPGRALLWLFFSIWSLVHCGVGRVLKISTNWPGQAVPTADAPIIGNRVIRPGISLEILIHRYLSPYHRCAGYSTRIPSHQYLQTPIGSPGLQRYNHLHDTMSYDTDDTHTEDIHIYMPL